MSGSTCTSRRPTFSSRGTIDKTRLRVLPVIGVLLATILTVSGCCAGYCSKSAPPVGAGVQQRSQSSGSFR
jgi:hypothetical protein